SQPFIGPPPKQNQKLPWSLCLISRQPFWLRPALLILSAMDISSMCSTSNFTQASTVKLPADTCRLGALPTFTKSSMPSRLKACPTNPAANVAPFSNVPLLPSLMSFALPSPGHQLTMFGGGEVQVGVGVGVGVDVEAGV